MPEITVPAGYTARISCRVVFDLGNAQPRPLAEREPIGYRSCAICGDWSIPVYEHPGRGRRRKYCAACASNLYAACLVHHRKTDRADAVA